MSLAAGTSLGRYEIQSPLGAGGMGEVYLARDPSLGRTVAIKLLPPAFATDPDRLRRFQQEAQTSAALNHPRILAIHDVGRAGDQPFIVMEYVRGETLSAFLRRGRPPLARALEIGIEIADALAAAHGARIVHRDLKPANIMLTVDGHVKVLDFGLAKFLWTDTSAPTGPDAERQDTSTGRVLGTPGYMAPEQILGDRVDGRTDIYTLGVILYEMVTGQRPYGDIFDVLTVEDPPVPIRSAHEVDEAIAPEVSAAIARAMARRPTERFQTAGELEQELRRLLLDESAAAAAPPVRAASDLPVVVQRRSIAWYAGWLVALAIAAGAGALLYNDRGIGTDVTNYVGTAKPVIAVVPLENLTGDPAKAYLGIGVADALEISLGRLSSLSVASRSNMKEAGVSTRPSAAARNLGVTLLVGGSIQQVGNVLRVNVTVTTPADGKVVWSRFIEGRDQELFTIQHRLAELLVNAMRLTLTAEESQNLARTSTEDVEALRAYYMGLELLDRPDDSNFDDAVSQLKQATTRDPRFSLAYAALGEAYRRRSVKTNDAAMMQQASAAVTEALRIDPNQPDVRLSLAGVLRSTGRPAAAVDEVRRVLSDQPENDNAHRLLGMLLSREGRSQEALAALQKAAELRPNYFPNQEQLGLFYYANNRLPEAIEAFTLITTLKPDDALPFQQLGSMYLSQGDFVRARENFEKSNKVKPNAASFANLGLIAFLEGRYAAAVREYEAAMKMEPNLAIHHGNVGDAYRKVGRVANARAAYGKAIDLGEQALQVNPNDTTMVSRLGVYYAKVGSLTRATQYATRAAQTSPTDPDVLYLRAVVLVLNGQRDAAMRQLSEAIDLGYPIHFALKDDDLAPLRSLQAFQRLTAAKPK